jgi:glycosyltransferase involved in cell wall biosynthesis
MNLDQVEPARLRESEAGLQDDPPVVLAIHLREEGNTGVHTHVRELRRYLETHGSTSTLVTPFSWARLLTYPVFGLRRLVMDRMSQSAGVAWYERWHEAFLAQALRKELPRRGRCVVYVQGPLEARAALRARRGPEQRVVMAVHFRVSRADEYADSAEIPRGGRVFRAIRQMERDVIPRVDGLVYVSRWGRDVLLEWLPEAAEVPSVVIGNFVAPRRSTATGSSLADLVTTGRLETAKNHRFLLDVLAVLRGAGRRLTLDIYGDGPLRTDLEQRAAALGLEGQVRFRGFRADVRDFLPRYRAYVHASYSESLPLSIIEAMEAGLPIVAGDAGGIREICDDGVEARFWSLADPAAAAATLIDLLGDDAARAAAAEAAERRFHRDYDADVVAPRLMSFLQGTFPSTPETR